jgi:hypothetical protein
MPISNLEYWTQRIIPQVYEDSMSHYELLSKVIAKLNEVIDLSNEFFNANYVEQYVNEMLNTWKDDGTLDQIINENIFNDLNTQITANTSDVAQALRRNKNAWVDVKEDYGAKGDGVTDDTTAIQSAIDFVFSKGGGVVFLPVGSYKTTSSIKLKSEVSLQGSGMYATTLLKTGNYNLIQGGVPGDYVGNRVDYFSIKDMTLLGQNYNGNGISLTHCHYFNIENLEIKDNGTTGKGLSAEFSWNGYIKNVSCINNYDNFWIYNQANSIDCYSLYSNRALRYGFFLAGCYDLNVNDICHDHGAQNVIHIGEYVRGIKINGVYIEAFQTSELTGHAIYCTPTATGDNMATNISLENVAMILKDYNDATITRPIWFRQYIDGVKVSNVFIKLEGTANMGSTGLINFGKDASNSIERTKNVKIDNIYVDDRTTGGSAYTRIIHLESQVDNAIIENLGGTRYDGQNCVFIRRPEGQYSINIQGRTREGLQMATPPTTGQWLRGQIIFNLNPSPGGYVGWVCTSSGTPGVFKGFGLIEA